MTEVVAFIGFIVLLSLSIYSCSLDSEKAHKWCDPRGYEVFYENRNGYRCKDPETGLVYMPS